MTAKQTKIKTAPHEVNQRLMEELRWYGNTIAVDGPRLGYKNAAIKAGERWKTVTEKLLNDAP